MSRDIIKDNKWIYKRFASLNVKQEETMYMVLSETTHRDDETINDQLVLKGHAKKLDTLVSFIRLENI